MSGKKKVKRLIKDGIRCLDGLKTEMQPMQKLEGSRQVDNLDKSQGLYLKKKVTSSKEDYFLPMKGVQTIEGLRRD